jgi:hypothetical protein
MLEDWKPYDGSILSSRKPTLVDNIITHLMHSITHCDLDHSCTILYKLRDTVKWSSFIVGRAIEISMPNFKMSHYQTARRQIPWRWLQKIVESRSLLIKWIKLSRVLLLHSLRPRTLFLNTPQVSWYRHVIFIWPRKGDGGMDTKLYGGTLPDCTAGITLTMASNYLVVSWSFLIMCTKEPRTLLLDSLRMRPLLLHTSKLKQCRHVIFIWRREGDGGSIPNCTVSHYHTALRQLPWR